MLTGHVDQSGSADLVNGLVEPALTRARSIACRRAPGGNSLQNVQLHHGVTYARRLRTGGCGLIERHPANAIRARTRNVGADSATLHKRAGCSLHHARIGDAAVQALSKRRV